MKKIILLVSFALAMFACKSNPVTNLDRKSQVQIKGDWTITNVSFVGQDYFKVNSFGIADSKCFVGSTWKFISNNNKGNMALTAASCPAFSSAIVWSVNENGVLGLKFKVANQTETTFELIQKIDVGGKLSDVTYTFTKN
jgi:Lipocalin-like domain